MSRNAEESHNRFQTILKQHGWEPGWGNLQKTKNASKNKRKRLKREIKMENKRR